MDTGHAQTPVLPKLICQIQSGSGDTNLFSTAYETEDKRYSPPGTAKQVLQHTLETLRPYAE